MFKHIPKHLKLLQKYSAARRILNSLLRVWKCAGQTRSFDVFHILPGYITKTIRSTLKAHKLHFEIYLLHTKSTYWQNYYWVKGIFFSVKWFTFLPWNATLFSLVKRSLLNNRFTSSDQNGTSFCFLYASCLWLAPNNPNSYPSKENRDLLYAIMSGKTWNHRYLLRETWPWPLLFFPSPRYYNWDIIVHCLHTPPLIKFTIPFPATLSSLNNRTKSHYKRRLNH